MATLPQSLATARQITQQVGSMVPLGQISSVVQTLQNIQGFNPGAFSQLSGTIQSALQGFDQASSIVQGFASGSPVQAFTSALSATGLAGSSISQIAGAAGTAYQQADSFLNSVAQMNSWAKLNSGRPSVESSRLMNQNMGRTLFFPQDIGKYWISLSFESANYNTIMGSQNGYYTRKNNGGVILPVPMNLVDANRLDYKPVQVTNEIIRAAETAAAVTGGLMGGRLTQMLSAMYTGAKNLGDTGSALTGIAVNTHQTLKFNQPVLKEHAFSWKLVPSNPKEAQTLATIINYIKSRIYPRSNTAVFQYPDLVNVILFNGEQMFFFKPAYVQTFAVKYNEESGPAFHKDGYPVSVQIEMTITENAVWTANDFGRPELTGGEVINQIKSAANGAFSGLTSAISNALSPGGPT